MNRRSFLGTSTLGLAALARAQQQSASVPEAIRALKPMTDGVEPITLDERRGRIEKARRLMHDQKIDAVFMQRGTSLFYFPGTRAAQIAGLVIPAKGDLAWLVPASQSPPDDIQICGSRASYLG